jgi:hypothetical protein
MSDTAAGRRAPVTPRGALRAGLAILAAAVVGTAVVPFASSSWTSFGMDVRRGSPAEPVADDGSLPDGVSVFADEYAGVANLAPDLLRALRAAASDAALDGVELVVNSGWRSRAYQEQLLREAVSQHGSAQEAARWVATADTSAHVAGDAVDIGPPDAATWLAAHGAEHGLCPIYRNEPWHYELRPEATRRGCPETYADPTQDPRMQPSTD